MRLVKVPVWIDVWYASQTVKASASAQWNGRSDWRRWPIEILVFLAFGQAAMRPPSQAACWSPQSCAPPTRSALPLVASR